ncbi:MAG: HIG1 domain-containing protein [Pseudomonadota bacterium]|nr:HIG1 domain-containing protein [Pseudomonadota bacterium]
MSYVLIPVLVIMMVLVVISLVKGIVAFMQSTREDLERPESAGPSEMQLKQNKMMYARIMYQGIAIVIVAFLLFASR